MNKTIKLKALFAKDIKVEVNTIELIQALALNLDNKLIYDALFNQLYNRYWEVKENKLIEMHNISYHGTPNYKETGRIIEGEDFEIYSALKLLINKSIKEGNQNKNE